MKFTRQVKATSLIPLLIALLSIATPAYAHESCARDKRVVANCYDVHGRLRINANLRLYLWPIGTKRLLGIGFKSSSTEADYYMPENLSEKISLVTEVFGDFRVCPFTKQKPGVMQIVCIDSASKLRIKNHP